MKGKTVREASSVPTELEGPAQLYLSIAKSASGWVIEGREGQRSRQWLLRIYGAIIRTTLQ
jgi:hypothetical protein